MPPTSATEIAGADVVSAALVLSGESLVSGRGEGKRAFRLARQAGYKRRMDDHVTKYVESLP